MGEDKKEVLQPLQIDKETYLSRLPDADRENLRMISQLFEEEMRSRGTKGVLLAVGGTLTKPLPRKDIDLAIGLEETKDFRHDRFENDLQFIREQFNFMEQIMRAIAERVGFDVKETVEPSLDEEFQSPNILKHMGKITIGKEGSVPIDIVIEPIGSGPIKRPFVVLQDVS